MSKTHEKQSKRIIKPSGDSISPEHYIALADALCAAKPPQASDAPLAGIAMNQWTNDVHFIADACRKTNPKFNRKQWIAYINGECRIKPQIICAGCGKPILHKRKTVMVMVSNGAVFHSGCWGK